MLRAQATGQERLAEAQRLARGAEGDRLAALAIYDDLIREAEASGNRRLEADAAYGKGDMLIVLGRDTAEAVGQLARAAQLRREAGDMAGTARALTLEGVALRRLGRLDESERVQRDALLTYEGAGDESGVAQVHHNLGALLYSRARYDEAADHYAQSIATRRRLGELAATAGTLNNLATVHSLRGDLDLALSAHREALDIATVSGNDRDRAYALLGLGTQSHALGEWQEAIGYLTDAAALFERLGDRSGLGFARHTLGIVYLTLGHDADAIGVLEQVLPLRSDDPARLGTTLQALGGAHRMRGDLDLARQHIERALALKRQASDTNGEAATLRALAALEIAAGRMEAALAHASASRTLATAIGTDDAKALALALESRARGSVADESLAGELDAAIARADAARARRTAVILRGERARVALAANDLARARDLIAAAVAGVEELRSGVASLDLRATWLASHADLLDLQVEVLLRSHGADPRAGFDREALAASERARGRRLLDALGDALLPPSDVAEARGRERALERDVNVAALKLDRARAGSRETLQADLDARLLALRTFRAEQRARLPWRRDPPAFDLAAMQRGLPENAAVVAYWLGSARSAAWVVTGTAVSLVELAPAARIHEAVDTAYASMTRDTAQPPDLEALARLVLHPVELLLPGRRVGLVVDGALESIPFGALPGRDGKPLVSSRVVVRLPSAMWMQQVEAGVRTRETRARRIAVVADPVFAPQDARVRRNVGRVDGSASTRTATLPARLPFSRREAEMVATLSPGTLVLADFEASKSRLMSLPLHDVGVLHLATHARQHADRPELSSVLLSFVDPDGTTIDGHLRLHEVVGLPLDGQLVVLSACSTIVGPQLRGEGLQGLARAFLQAGAGSVVASLWDVEDRATMLLMRHFYTGLIERRLSPAAALSAAQRAMRDDARWAHPRNWAGFAVVGSIE